MRQQPANGAPSLPFRETFRKDLLASVVVFLVALPLCMGIAVASGVPPAAGLITGIVGGIVVGLLAGCPLQVSGPAAGLTVIVADIVSRHGLEMLGVIVLLAGLLQIVAGAFHLGQVFRAVSPAVIHGMLAGIGVLIFASQFHVMVDIPLQAGGLKALLEIPSAIVAAFVPGSTHQVAAGIGVVTIVIIALWPMLAPKRLKLLPAALMGVGIASFLAWMLGLNISYIAIPDKLIDEVRFPTLVNIKGLLSESVLIAAVTVAMVASAETLLCASAVDQSAKGERTKYDKELVAQGVGNSICGLAGALPMTGVIVRSSANINAGGKTRLSAILHGFWLLVFVAALPAVIRLIPTSALAAMLVYTGYKLAHPKPVKTLIKYGKGEVAIYFITLATIVVFDLLTGVIAGILAAAIKLLYTFSHLHVRSETSADGKKTFLHLDGAATFIRLPRLATALEQVPGNTELHLRIDRLSYIDHACLELLDTWRSQHESTGGTLSLDWNTLHARGPLLAAPLAARLASRTAEPVKPPAAATRVEAVRDARDQAAVEGFDIRGVEVASRSTGSADEMIHVAYNNGRDDAVMGVFERPLVGLSLAEQDNGLLGYLAKVSNIKRAGQFRFAHVMGRDNGKLDESMIESLRTRMISRVQAHLGPAALDASYDVVRGSREDELLGLATEHGCDVIVLGHRREHSGQRALAKRLAMVANCSVWLVPDGSPASLRKVLVPVDFSKHAAEALSFAAIIAAEQGLESCTALHVTHDPSMVDYPEHVADGRMSDKQAFERFLSRIDTHGVGVETITEQSTQPAGAVLEVAKRRGMDLIVMNTQGRSRAAAILLGSITSRVMEQTTIPLLAFKHVGSRMTLLQALLHPRTWERQAAQVD